MREVLEDRGIEVLAEAENGMEAVRLALELQPDVITMDLDMPIVDGVQAIAELCADDCPPVIVVSGSTSSEQLGDALAAGARWHVAKRDVPAHLPQAVFALSRARHRLTVP